MNKTGAHMGPPKKPGYEPVPPVTTGSRMFSALETDGRDFVCSFDAIAAEARHIALDHGWDEANQNEGEVLCLMHSELSEALEALRYRNPPSEHIPEFNGVEEELADVVIRIMTYSKARGYKVGPAVLAKLKFNRERPYKHGGKAF